MIKLKLITLGQLTEPHWRAACEEYKKRLSHACSVQEIELKEVRTDRAPTKGDITAAMEKEADLILGQIPPRAFVVALC
ncbi:MAG: 23S rRNA (pseudouridine(1915)-N(3))-methyltransferase RlmH, partial [Clostridiales bacterium]|nr:23S rRNA (pseudouridine(1915)-N(3))-methyltransferase RlmH [Clostridiales bacterium]